jgi:hypothetical protein
MRRSTRVWCRLTIRVSRFMSSRFVRIFASFVVLPPLSCADLSFLCRVRPSRSKPHDYVRTDPHRSQHRRYRHCLEPLPPPRRSFLLFSLLPSTSLADSLLLLVASLPVQGLHRRSARARASLHLLLLSSPSVSLHPILILVNLVSSHLRNSHVFTCLCLGLQIGRLVIDPKLGGMVTVVLYDGAVENRLTPLPFAALPMGYVMNIVVGGLLTFAGFDTLASKIASFVRRFPFPFSSFAFPWKKGGRR